MISDLSQKNKLEIIGQLTASLTHEIRNSLSALKMNLDYLKDMKSQLPEDAVDSVNLSIEASERMNELVTNLLRFSRIENSVESIQLNDVSVEAEKLIKFRARAAKVELILDLEDDIPKINIPRNKILQVLINLITNAIDACEPRIGRVVIRTYTGQTLAGINNIVLEIEDNGIGIPEDDARKIFDEFFTSKKDGTGLGLHVCRKIAEEFNAELGFTSEYKRGSVFYLHFMLNSE